MTIIFVYDRIIGYPQLYQEAPYLCYLELTGKEVSSNFTSIKELMSSFNQGTQDKAYIL